MSTKIQNISDLRRHAITTLEKLEKNKIDCAEAGVTAKLYESVISSVKVELEYSRMLGESPSVKFIEDGNPHYGKEKRVIKSVPQIQKASK